MHPEIEKRVEESRDKHLRSLLSWMISAAIIVLGTALLAYIVAFRKHPLTADAEAWGQFGDFLGGTVNPIIGFLTLVALVLTLTLQNRQLRLSSNELRLSREELELTRGELQRSARAQELSEKALRAQAESAHQTAQLTALNFLLASYRTELQSLQGMAFAGNDPRANRAGIVKQRAEVLNQMVDELFTDVLAKKGEPE
jgi:hypothetical protein